MGNSPDQTNGAASSAAVGQDDALAQSQKLSADQTKEALWLHRHGDEYRARLLQNIKSRLPQLEKLLADLEFERVAEDGVHRFPRTCRVTILGALYPFDDAGDLSRDAIILDARDGDKYLLPCMGALISFHH